MNRRYLSRVVASLDPMSILCESERQDPADEQKIDSQHDKADKRRAGHRDSPAWLRDEIRIEGIKLCPVLHFRNVLRPNGLHWLKSFWKKVGSDRLNDENGGEHEEQADD